MRARPEHHFTKQEVQNWVDSVGGLFSHVIIPNTSYFIFNKVMYPDLPSHGKEACIVGIDNYCDDGSFVRFEIKAHGVCNKVWPEMRYIKPKVIINPYKNKCKKCGANSIRCKDFILCSNIMCKSRKQFNKYLSKLPKPKIICGETREHPIEIRCPLCHKLAWQTSLGLYAGRSGFHCIEHGWMDYIYTPQKYYKTDKMLAKYTEKGWE